MAYKNQASYRAWFTRTYASRKAFAISYLGGKCIICQTTEKLEFDHKNPTTKSGRIDQFLMLTLDKLKKELDKCQLLCEQHHKEKSNTELKSKYCKRGHLREGRNLVGRHCRICKNIKINEYKRNKRARLSQLAEETDLKSVKSEFKSQDGHHE